MDTGLEIAPVEDRFAHVPELERREHPAGRKVVPWPLHLPQDRIKDHVADMDDEVRVSGKKRDDLQDVIAKLRGAELGLALQFVNFRE